MIPSTLRNAPQAQSTIANVGSVARGFGGEGQIGSTFGMAPDVQSGYQHGEDFSADRQRIESGLMERLNPSLAIERNKYEQQLADQGIRYGSPAYENAMRNYSMQANDARLGVIGQGGAEQQRLSEMSRMAGEFYNKAQQQQFEQAKGRGEFANTAQQQAYEQAFGRGQFANAAQQQDFTQQAARGTFNNAALAQNFGQAQTAFNATNAARQQYLNEQFALRNQPINEISALLTGSQVAQPNFVNPNTSTVANTDVGGLINKNFDQQMAVSNQQSATANNIIGGLFGFAGGLGRGGFFNSVGCSAMSDTYVPSFFSDDPRSGALTYGQLEARRRIAAALATRNRAYPKTIGEGLSALGEGLGEGYAMRGLERAEEAQRDRDLQAGNVLTGGAPAAAPAAVPQAAPGPVSAAPDTDPQVMALATEQASGPEANVSPVMQALAPAGATATRQPLTPQQAAQQPSMSIEEWKQRIARNESGGRKDAYTLVGERSRRGDYPYGKYQVMGENIPKWTKGYLGREMTPEEFLADPDAQEQVATARGGEYMTKYGPNGAAAAWFAGEKGMNDPNRKDTLGTHVAEYGRRFNIPLVSREQVVRSAARAPGGVPEQPVDEGAVPPGATLASAPARQDIAAAMMQQRGQAPAPQQVAQAAPPPVLPPPMQQQPIRAAEERPTPAGPEPTLRRRGRQQPATAATDGSGAPDRARPGSTAPNRPGAGAGAIQELEKRANDEFTKQWTVWHERTKGEETFRLGRGGARAQAAGRHRPLAASPQQTGPDPRLGTPAQPAAHRHPGAAAGAARHLAGGVEQGADAAARQGDRGGRQGDAGSSTMRSGPCSWRGSTLAASGVSARPPRFATKHPRHRCLRVRQDHGADQGKNFLTAYQQLKGGGAITEIEGTKAEAAQARLATAQNKEDWDAAMNDLETALRRDMELAQRKVNAPVTAWRAPGDNSSTRA